MRYELSPDDQGSGYLQIKLFIENCHSEQLNLQMPAWRPGRYELQNFAQFIRKVKAVDGHNQNLPISKLSKDSWIIDTHTTDSVVVSYEFYADMPNAGGSVIQRDFLYVNPVNCCMYIPSRQNEACEMEVNFNSNNDVACGMSHIKTEDKIYFTAKDFHELADSPFFISSKLHHLQYAVQDVQFHVWIRGAGEFPLDRIKADFSRFTEAQINVFGEFPEKEFHFMLWLSAQASYHGVEHSKSTMMTLGPNTDNFDQLYTDLLGLASHELFHAWNVKRIRPVELLPYDYCRENYFTTCFVAEGITTFYGDWMLHRSGVFDDAAYQKELETTLRRHFETADTADLSLLESSYDLWLDGYKKGAPDRKVSVYHKGAAAALILNYLIEQSTKGQRNLDDLMKLLWLRFGKPFKGYSYEDYIQAAEEIAGCSLSQYFKKVIEGNDSIFDDCNLALHEQNLTLQRNQEGFVQLVTQSQEKQ